jgi:DNA-binding NarL/FixJ family response regulator
MHVLLVEDHALVREGFRMILESTGRFAGAVEHGSIASALAYLARGTEDVGLVILDLGLPDTTGLDGLDRIVAVCPSAPVIVVSGEAESDTIREAFARGAKGYVPKTSSGPTFRGAVEAVLRGELYVPPHVLAGAPPDRPPPPSSAARLTPRQEDVLVGIARGLPNKEIASELGMSPATVRIHVTAILKTLGVENRTQAAISPAAKALVANRAACTRAK